MPRPAPDPRPLGQGKVGNDEPQVLDSLAVMPRLEALSGNCPACPQWGVAEERWRRRGLQGGPAWLGRRVLAGAPDDFADARSKYLWARSDRVRTNEVHGTLF